MDINKNNKSFTQPPKKVEMPSKTASTSSRPEIDLPLKGDRSDTEVNTKSSPRKDDKIMPDKKSVR